MNYDQEDQLLDEDDRMQDVSIKASRKLVSLLYAWGKNQDGELSLGQAKIIEQPKPLKTTFGYAKQVQSAHTHSVLVTAQGQLYVTGSLLHDKLGLDKEVKSISKFHIQPHLQNMRVRQVACGAYHTLALIENGDVYSWGGTLWGKTGQKSGRVNQVHMLAQHKIVEISCGDFHSLALSDKGEVFSWGGGGTSKNKGQLGHSNLKDLENPEQIMFFKNKKVKAIACGDYHTMALTADDQLYAWGQGNYGQLGYGGKQDSHTPKKITINFNNNLMLQEYFTKDSGKEKPKVTQISLGGKHSLLLTNKGHLYVCGYGMQGQLGLGKSENATEPTLVNCLVGKRIIMVAAGSNHSLALTDKSNVYCCGYNHKGQLGLSDDKSRTIWTHLTALAGKRVSRIYAGGFHSWAVLDRVSPIIQDYEPPSPLKIGNNYSEDMGRSNQIPRADNRSAVSNLTFIETLQQLSPNNNINYCPKSCLQTIYTDVDMYHRFIRFTIRDQSRARQALEQFLAYCYDVEKGHLKFHRFQNDSDLFDGQGNLISQSDRKACTIMLVSDFPASKDGPRIDNKVSIPIGQMAILKESQLRYEGRVLPQYKWFFKFGELFDGIIDRSRILELRPKTF